MRKIDNGEEVGLCYSASISNTQWFLQFGFIDYPNNCDSIALPLKLTEDAPGWDWKKSSLHKKMHYQYFKVTCDLSGKNFTNFLSFARFICLKKKDRP